MSNTQHPTPNTPIPTNTPNTQEHPTPNAQRPTPPPAFSLVNVHYQHSRGVVALDGVGMEITQGEKVAILGANGCGKSTLLRLLNGLLFAQSGTVEAFGIPLTETNLRDEATAHRFRRRVGFVFQNSDAQLFSPTVREEIAFGPLQMGLDQAEVEQRIREVIGLLDIQNLLERAPFQLSGGEKKKVAIASTLVINPDALLLDEPTAGLDPRSQAWLVELLVRLHGAGKTLITATHDLNLVPDLADRVLIFSEQHRIVAEGSTQTLLADADLLVRVNLIHANWHRHGTLWHFHTKAADRPHSHG